MFAIPETPHLSSVTTLLQRTPPPDRALDGRALEIVVGMALRGLDPTDQEAVARYQCALKDEAAEAMAAVAAHQQARRPVYPQPACYGHHWRDDD